MKLLESIFSGFTGSDSDYGFNRCNKNFSITDTSGFGCFFNCLQDFGQDIVGNNDFKFDLWNKIDHIFGSTIKFRVTFLTAETLNLAYRDTLDTDFVQSLFNIIQLERFDYCVDFFQTKLLPCVKLDEKIIRVL